MTEEDKIFDPEVPNDSNGEDLDEDKMRHGGMDSSSDAESTKIVAFAVEPSSILLRREHRSRRLNFKDRIEKIS